MTEKVFTPERLTALFEELDQAKSDAASMHDAVNQSLIDSQALNTRDPVTRRDGVIGTENPESSS